MSIDRDYVLKDRFARRSGRVYLTGNDTLVRLLLEQGWSDKKAGMDTAGFVTGYRGSPLGTLDMALEKAAAQLSQARVTFEPGLNEDLAATAVWGTQQASLLPDATVEGVFGMWYGKGPGVDRSADALKHANQAGVSSAGGVLAIAGDDPAAKSSSLAHQSEPVLAACGIPVLSPSFPEEFITFGLAGWAASRYSGGWVSMRIPTDLVESAATVDLDGIQRQFRLPDRAISPDRFIEWARPALDQERVTFDVRLPAVQDFVRANGLDRLAFGAPAGRIGIVTSGKTFADVMETLSALGIDQRRAEERGLGVFKVALAWPMERSAFAAFASGFDEILMVEEKRPLMEEQAARILYGRANAPRLLGKHDAEHAPLIPAVGELNPNVLAPLLARVLGVANDRPKVAGPRLQLSLTPLTRKPAFCAGCPHNTSTQVLEGSFALGGIGCHGMASYMPERRTLALTHMGAEGANWIGISPYTRTEHVFQNMGDGTFYHSGLLAIRAAVAARRRITYKILANGAVAMTGGQNIEGHSIEATGLVRGIVASLSAEAVSPVIVVSDKPEIYSRGMLAKSVEVVHRDKLPEVQDRLRQAMSVSALVYDQTCAAEARRLRKRGTFPEPDRRVIINELVCEGCGDCNTQSNCIAVEPLDTEFGRKRMINQDSCNKDFSCLRGYCPSFAIVSGGRLKKRAHSAPPKDAVAALPAPAPAFISDIYNVFVAGIGGTGIVTAGSLIAMAAHVEGKHVTQLDVTGLAQKNGSVSSHVRIAPDQVVRAPRLSTPVTDVLIGADLVVASERATLQTCRPGRTRAVVNLDIVPTADFATNPSMDLSSAPYADALAQLLGSDALLATRTRTLARELVGTEMGVNIFLLGHALQSGLLPVSLEALQQAIRLNGVALETNLAALDWGRLAAHDPSALSVAIAGADAEQAGPGADPLAARVSFLAEYQNPRYAAEYSSFVDAIRDAERQVTGGSELSEAVMRNLFKLMAYKDEYEVARLYTDGSFKRQLENTFDGDYRVRLNLAPQVGFPKDRRTGRPKKVIFPPAIFFAFRILAGFRFLRGTPFDLFGKTAHRGRERALIAQYRNDLTGCLDGLAPETYPLVVELARLPEEIRGYGDIKDAAIERAAQRRQEILSRLEEGAALISG